MMKGRQSAMRCLARLGLLALLGVIVSVGFAQGNAAPTPSSPQGEDTASLTLQKDSDRATVPVGQSVVYTVSINNLGPVEDTVTVISDTLPSGFTFLAMSEAGDVITPPLVVDGTLTWQDPLTVPVGESRRLAYRVRAGGIDLAGGSQFKDNGAEARLASGAFLGPAYATVRVDPAHVYVPLATYSERPATTLPFVDNFDYGVSSDWQVFLNYPGLRADDWYWSSGYYIYEPADWKGYALSMYLGEGSDEWTNYQVIATIKNRKERIGGIWVRGGYEQVGGLNGGRVGGYYVVLKPADGYVYLLRIRPETRLYYDAWEVAAARYPPGIGTRRFYHLKVAVQGANIKVWLKEVGDPESAYVQLINWTDAGQAYMQGTVGFVGYRTNIVYDGISVTELPASNQ